MRHALPLIGALIALLAAHAAIANTYFLQGHADQCRYGVGGMGIIAIGAGTLSVTESHFERVSQRQPLAGGWQRAQWACMAEGMECGRHIIEMKFDDDQIALRVGDQLLTGTRCRP